MQKEELPSSMLNGVITLFPIKRPYSSAQLETDTITEYGP
jgi:hypothetical protein